MTWCAANEPVECFDCNGNGRDRLRRRRLALQPPLSGSARPRSFSPSVGVQGGAVGVESVPGEGTTIFFTLPDEIFLAGGRATVTTDARAPLRTDTRSGEPACRSSPHPSAGRRTRPTETSGPIQKPIVSRPESFAMRSIALIAGLVLLLLAAGCATQSAPPTGVSTPAATATTIPATAPGGLDLGRLRPARRRGGDRDRPNRPRLGAERDLGLRSHRESRRSVRRRDHGRRVPRLGRDEVRFARPGRAGRPQGRGHVDAGARGRDERDPRHPHGEGQGGRKHRLSRSRRTRLSASRTADGNLYAVTTVPGTLSVGR